MSKYNWVWHARHVRGILAEGAFVINAAATPSARTFLACILYPGYLVKVGNYIPTEAIPS
jgi:hypothetical protein